jgi:hypothetical protein
MVRQLIYLFSTAYDLHLIAATRNATAVADSCH